MEAIEPIIHDLKDGSLKRVRKSTYDKYKRRSSEIISPTDDDIFSNYSNENEDVMGSEFRESNDSSSYGLSKDNDNSLGRSIKSKQMRSVLQTIEAAKRRTLESSETSNIQVNSQKDKRRSEGDKIRKQLSQKEIRIEKVDSWSPQ